MAKAITTQNVFAAHNEAEGVQMSTESSFKFPTNLNPEPTADRAYVVFKLVKKRQRRLNVDGICDNAINPKTNEPERIFLLRGAHSIWQSELVELLKDRNDKDSYYSKNRISLHFEDGICRVPVNQKRMLEYARAHTSNVGKNRNGAGKFDFYEYDPSEEQKMRAEKELNKVKAIVAVQEMQLEPMRKLASYMGITFADELGMPKGDDGVRTDLLLKASAMPDTVMKYMNSKEVEIAWMVKRAIVDAHIDLHGQSGNAMWAKGQGFIAKIPTSRKPYEYLTELAMTNSKEGKQFLEQLESIV